MNDERSPPETDKADETRGNVPARFEAVLPDKIYLLSAGERPFFPPQTMAILADEKLALETVERVGSTPHQLFGICRTTQPADAAPRAEDFAETGTVVRLHHPQHVDGKIQLIAEGIRRFHIVRWISRRLPYLVQVEYPEPPAEDRDQIRAYALAIVNTIRELLPLNPLYKEQLRAFLDRYSPDEPSALTDFAAVLTSAGGAELQEVLETVPLQRRMEKVLVLIRKEVDVAGMQAQIQQRVQETIGKQQKDFFLREQLKAIQKELGISKDDKTLELERFQERLKTLQPSESARKRIDDELQKLSFLELGSPEYGVTRNYLDVLTALPWGRYSDDILDLKRARSILDRDHDGLEDVKDRIIEFLAIGVRKREITGAILLLVGPPGVGKTSVGRSIAEVLGRKFYRFSLGGMRDEAEIKGHRRTYIGAMPGKFILAMKEAGTANPVIMLDEIDKIGASYQGDPASSLLEVLDPEQNSGFLDHYLDVRFDLSKVLFICTANQLDTIPAPLRDRMEVIRLAGYINAEKVRIARRHLWPKQLAHAGIDARAVRISDSAMRRVIDGYAREAGVRNLEKCLGKLIRKAVVGQIEGARAPTRIGTRNLESFLGPPLFRKERPVSGVGVATGLAWTALGGATLSVEAAKVHGMSRGFRLTGQLGAVMKESAEIAYSYVVANSLELGVRPGYFDKVEIHLHVPEGATPKDGPSAGITMASALVSLGRRRRIPRPLAMTGELTLTGRILAVGGIREKIVAARRVGIRELVLPQANQSDFGELPAYLRKGLKLHFVEHFPEACRIIFGSGAAR